MYIGRSQQEEEKYLNTTINAINELIDEYGGLSTEQDKEIRKQRKFLWDNRSEFDEFEVLENCSQIALEEKTYANKINKLRTLERQLKSPYFARLDFKEEGEEGESFYIGLASVEDKDNFDFYAFDEAVRNEIRKEYKLEDKYVIGHVGRFQNQKRSSDFFRNVMSCRIEVCEKARKNDNKNGI